MSTNATIMRKTEEGKIEAIYLHWDGYPSHVMDQLPAYDTCEKVAELLALGDLSQLEPSIAECVAYHRDKEEPWEDIKTEVFDTVDEAEKFYGNTHNYLWDPAHDATDPKQRSWRIV